MKHVVGRGIRVIRGNFLILLEWLVGLVGLAISVATLPKDHGLAAVVGLLGGVFVVHGIWRFVQEYRRYGFRRTSRKRWEYDEPYDSWEHLGGGRTDVIFSRDLNHRLAEGASIAIDIGLPLWTPEGAAGEARKRWIRTGALNETKLRLATDLLSDGDGVVLDRTDYASFMFTNRLAYEQQWDLKSLDVALSFDHVEPRAKDGHLPTLAASRCSNHIGGDVLAVGRGFCFVQMQKPTNGMYPSMFVGSASGSFDAADYRPGDSLQDVVKTGLLRELVEEMGLKAAVRPTPDDVKVIGYVRATYLGGKPQFFGLCRIGRVDPRRADRYVERFERLHFLPDDGVEGLLNALEEFVDEHPDEVSPPLEMQARVLRIWAERDPGAATDWLFGSSLVR